MEQASGSIGQVHVGSLLTRISLLYYILLLLWPFTVFRLFVYFQVDAGVSYRLDYVEDIYDDSSPLCPD